MNGFFQKSVESHAMQLEFARKFALGWQGSQMYGNLRYEVHLDDVVALLQSLGLELWKQIAGYTHDLLEDTDCTPDEIERNFGSEVLRWSEAVSGRGANRKERQADIRRKLLIHRDAVILKLCDRLANVRRSFQQKDAKKLAMYRKDIPIFDDLFEEANPKLNAELKQLLSQPL